MSRHRSNAPLACWRSALPLLCTSLGCRGESRRRQAGIPEERRPVRRAGEVPRGRRPVPERAAAGPEVRRGALQARGGVRRRQGDARNAFREYVRAADLLPDNVDAQVKAAAMLLMARQFEDAKARAQKALAKDPKNVQAQIMLGNAHGRPERFRRRHQGARGSQQAAADASAPTRASAP